MDFTAFFEETMKKNIALLEADIAQLITYPEVQSRWDIDPLSNLEIKFGSDIENKLYDPVSRKTVDVGNYKGFQFCRIFTQQTLYTSYTPASYDSDYRIEFRPSALPPLSFAQRFKEYQDIAKKIASSMGLEHRQGSAHWHFSALINGQWSLLDGNSSSFYSRFVNQLFSSQDKYTALWVSPYRTERTILTDGSKYLRYGKLNDGTVISKDETYDGLNPKFEVRVSNLSPYMPIFLMLEAFRSTLLGDIEYYQEDKALVHGKYGGNLLLEELEDSESVYQNFPKLKTVFLLATIKEYQGYLQKPYAGLYTKEEKEMLRETMAFKASALQNELQVEINSGNDFLIESKTLLPAFNSNMSTVDLQSDMAGSSDMLYAETLEQDTYLMPTANDNNQQDWLSRLENYFSL